MNTIVSSSAHHRAVKHTGFARKQGLLGNFAPKFTHSKLSNQKSRASLIAHASIKVDFTVENCPLEFGQSLKIVGSDAALGSWEASTGLTLEWHEGNNWKGATNLESGSAEFKIVKIAGEEIISWEDGDNKIFSVSGHASVVCSWGSAETGVTVHETQEEKKPAAQKKTTKVKAVKVDDSEEKAESKPKKTKKEPETAPVTAAPVVTAVEPEAPAPAVSNTDNGSSSIHLPEELKSLAKKIDSGADGTLTIEFNDTSGLDAAALAAKLL